MLHRGDGLSGCPQTLLVLSIWVTGLRAAHSLLLECRREPVKGVVPHCGLRRTEVPTWNALDNSPLQVTALSRLRRADTVHHGLTETAGELPDGGHGQPRHPRAERGGEGVWGYLVGCTPTITESGYIEVGIV